MPMKPVADWISTYEPSVKDYYDLCAIDPFHPEKNLWSKWIDKNAQGISVVAPYAASTGTTNVSSFSPLALKTAKSAPQVAVLMATAWRNWYNAITFTPPPPLPPFSAITAVAPSPSGVAAAYAILVASLTAELSITVPDPALSFLLKAKKFGTIFNTATKAAGVQITGLGIGGPPPPLVLPLVAVN